MIASAEQASTYCWFPGLGLVPAEARCQVVNEDMPLYDFAVKTALTPAGKPSQLTGKRTGIAW